MKGRMLFLPISGRRGASARYRVYQYEDFLREAGLDARIVPPAPKGHGLARAVGRWREERDLLREAAEVEVVFIQKRLFSCGFMDRLARTGKPIVFDLDDAIFRAAHKERSAPTRRRVLSRLVRVLEASSLVLAGNDYLADFARKHARRVEVLPTVVDVRRYAVKKHVDSGRCVLGWIGSAATQPYLDLIRQVLLDVSADVPGPKLVVVSDADYELPGMDVEGRRWSEETEAEDLLSFDIGLMPLEDNNWTRGKCALKALQYMAAGVPPVCSAVGAARNVIENGTEGFLCETEAEWKAAIKQLASDPSLRNRIGEKARRKVEDAYSLEKTGAELVALLRDL